MSIPIKQILVTGGGIIGWWAAVFLKKTMPEINVSILNSPVVDSYAVTTEPMFAKYLHLIGITEQQLIKYADGNFCFAQAYSNWPAAHNHYFHTADKLDLSCDAVEFNQWLLKLRQAGHSLHLDDYSLSAVAVRSGKSPVLPSSKALPSLSFDARYFKKMLQSYALELGVAVIDDEVKNITIDTQGEIEFITSSKNGILKSDFYIDATVQGDLIGKALGVDYENWSAFLPFHKKKVLAVPPQDARLIPFTSVHLSERGWVKSTPLKNIVMCEYTYTDSIATENKKDPINDFFSAATATLFQPGMRQKSWHKNCLALGPAATTLDSFSHSSFYLATVALKQFISYWPHHSQCNAIENEFNRLIRMDYEAVRDFHAAHYAAIKMQVKSPHSFWSHIELPESLHYRLNLFMECGRTLPDENTLIDPSQWIHLWIGLGCWPRSYDYIANHLGNDIYWQYSQQIRNNVQDAAKKLPDYNSYMKAFVTH
ncbi:MAG: tryptophan 7-halogenase [Pseudomonadota bacterium]